MKIKTRIFVVGCPRSGTTLVQSLLGAHSDIKSFPESHMFVSIQNRRMMQKLGLASERTKKTYNEFVDQAFPDLTAPFRPGRFCFTGKLIREFLKLLDQATLDEKKSNWLEKTPRHLEFIETINRYVDDTFFIHVLRSAKDVVASLHKVTNEYPEIWGGKRSIDVCVQRWKKSVEISAQFVDHERHAIVDYHELIKNPAQELGEICRRLDLPFEENQLLTFQNQGKNIITSNEPWKSRNREPLKDNRGEVFRAYFDAEAQQQVEKLLKESELPNQFRHLTECHSTCE